MDRRAKDEVKKGSFRDGIRAMFDDIAPTYDLLNRINSLGLDQWWRRDLVERVAQEQPQLVLDLAAGTGDLSILLAKECTNATIVASDLSIGMLEIGSHKANEAGLSQVKISVEDAMDLSFDDYHFDAVTCAFGVRNFESIARGYQEIYRVLRPGGMVAILELCEPTNLLLKAGYDLYVDGIIPNVAKWVGRNKEAYDYLGQSIKKVPQRQQMEKLMQMAGFVHTYHKVYAPEVCALYVGYKPKFKEFGDIYSRLYQLKRE